MQARAYLLLGAEDDLRLLVFPVIISLICHLIFFALIIYSPSHLPGRKMSQTIVNVSLVTLSQIQAAPDLKGLLQEKPLSNRWLKRRRPLKQPRPQNRRPINQNRQIPFRYPLKSGAKKHR